MNNKEFDDIIKNKLESLNTNGSEDAWDLFKEKWDSESTQTPEPTLEEELDAKIKKDMQNLRMPFNSKHWIILKEQLELEALFKKKLFIAKSVELLVLAFLIVGILNLWPIQKDIYQIPVYDIPMVASVPVNKATAEKHTAQEKINTIKQNDLYQSAKKLVQNTIFLSDTKKSDQKTPSTKNPSINKTIDNNSNPKDSEVKNGQLEYPFLKLDDSDSDLIDPKNNRQDIIALLQAKQIKNLDIPVRSTNLPDVNILKEVKVLPKEEKTYLSFAIGPKVNLINSPFDPVYGFDPYNTINTNFNISAKINKEIGPIELFAGLGYTSTSYTPRLVDEIYEPLERQFNVASLENIEFKTFNIPLGIKHRIVESKVLEFYASAGLGLNIIADSEYTILDEPVGSRSQPAPAAPSSKNTVNSNAKLSQKEFNKGILSGGSLKDNLYASASFGLGLNIKTSSKSGVFIEPRYSHFISSKGIGPNEDKVHGLSIDLGVRYQIN